MYIPILSPVLYAGLILVLSLNSGLPVQGQHVGQAVSFEESLSNFESGSYRPALEGFRNLMQSDPGNAMHWYYAGRCLVELNEEIENAIEYLHSASRRRVPADAVFYLGRAYHQNYNFSAAKKYYSRFELEGTKEEVKNLRVKHMINTCRSALLITASYNQYEVMTVAFMDLTDSVSYSQIRMKGGQLQRKPADYFRQGEDTEGLLSLMFMPFSPQRGDYIFFAGPAKSAEVGSQLFRVKKGYGRSWGDPQEIKTLSTEGDELLPYYDPIEHDLYYASDGGSGVGGFDLYRAHYDADRDEWAEPINLGFPINSVMDDYLLLPGSDLGMMMFFSNRQGTDSTLTVYRVHLVEPKLKTDANNTRMLKELANLGDVANELLAEISAISDQERDDDPENNYEKRQDADEGDPDMIYTPVKIMSTEGSSTDGGAVGKEYLSDALMHQAASDSLKDLAGEARARVRESDDPNDRWVWQKQIMVWEKMARDEEELADVFYSMMDEKSTAKLPASSVNSPEAFDSRPSEATVSTSAVEGEPGTQPLMKAVPATGASVYMNRFDILGSSPYSESSPIPLDVTLPGGVFYRIQIGVFGRPVKPGTFKGISPITAETISERGLIKYYAGKFSIYEDASTALSKVRSRGYEDAFLSAWYNGNPVSTHKAKQLE